MVHKKSQALIKVPKPKTHRTAGLETIPYIISIHLRRNLVEIIAAFNHSTSKSEHLLVLDVVLSISSKPGPNLQPSPETRFSRRILDWASQLLAVAQVSLPNISSRFVECWKPTTVAKSHSVDWACISDRSVCYLYKRTFNLMLEPASSLYVTLNAKQMISNSVI